MKPYADSHPGYDRIGKVMTTDHQTVKHSLNEWVKGDVHTNTLESVWSLLDRAIVASYHKLFVKHLPRTRTNSPSGSITGRTRSCSVTRCRSSALVAFSATTA